MDRELFEASLTGNVQVLNALLQKDELILDRVSLSFFSETPLHIAALRGHLDFVKILLSKKPTLATSLDSVRRTPLHLASAEGHVEVIRELLQVMSPDGCRVRDQDGRTALQLAVMNEQLEAIRVLVQTKPDLGRDLGGNGETVLHTCISYNRFEALKLLSPLWNEDELAKLADGNGNTLLHLAVVHKQIQTIKYLLEKSSIKANVNVVNKHGFTALDVLDHSPQDFGTLQIQNLLMEANFLRAKDVRPFHTSNESNSSQTVTDLENRPTGCMSRAWNWYLNNNGNWLEKQRGILILATVVVATAAFFSGLHPPGGTFTSPKDGPIGNAIRTETVEGEFDNFLIQNTIIMVLSLLILVVLLSGIPLRNKFCLWVLNIAVLCIVFFAIVTYLQQIDYMSPGGLGGVNGTTIILCFLWILLCLLFGFIHTIFFITWVVKGFPKARILTQNIGYVGV